MFDDSIRVTVVGTSPLEEGYSYVQRGGLSVVLQIDGATCVSPELVERLAATDVRFQAYYATANSVVASLELRLGDESEQALAELVRRLQLVLDEPAEISRRWEPLAGSPREEMSELPPLPWS